MMLTLRGNGTLCSLPGSPSFMLSSPQFARLLPPSLPFKWILSCALSLSFSRYNCNDGQPSARQESSCSNGCQDLPICQQRCNSEASKKFIISWHIWGNQKGLFPGFWRESGWAGGSGANGGSKIKWDTLKQRVMERNESTSLASTKKEKWKISIPRDPHLHLPPAGRSVQPPYGKH